MMRTHAAACLFLLAPLLSAQDPDGPSSKPAKLKEWPELAPTDVQRIPGLLGQFRKKNPELHRAAHRDLVALGDAAAPLLLARLTDNRVNFNEPILAVLDEVLGPRHADLLAGLVKSKKVVQRRYLLRRLAAFADPDLAPVFAAAAGDRDEDVAFYAALGAAGLGELAPLATVLERCRSHWRQDGERIAEVLAHARSIDSGRFVLERLRQAKTGERIAGLRMLRYLAPPELSRAVAVYLDDQQHSVKKEAINALRVIHGEKALENLSVFQAIEMAKQWKARL